MAYRITIAAGLLIAAGTEIIQDYIPGRSSDLQDFGFNLLGIVCAMIFYVVTEKRLQSYFN